MSPTTTLPKSVVSRLNNTVQSLETTPESIQKDSLYKNLLTIIASMVAATSASLLQYNQITQHSTVICEYGSQRMGILERRSDVGASYDEREFQILFRWIDNDQHLPLMLHVDQLPSASSERREFQKYAIHSSLYLPIVTDSFWGYIELWESRYKRVYTDVEIVDLMQAAQYLIQVIRA